MRRSAGRRAALCAAACLIAIVAYRDRAAAQSPTADPRWTAWYNGPARELVVPELTLAADAPTSRAATEYAPVAAPPDMAVGDEQPSSKPAWLQPFSFEITYLLMSDYVDRGVNLTEYPTERREKPVHQLDTIFGVDLGKLSGRDAGQLGTFYFEGFLTWFAAQHELDPLQGQHNLQYVEYYLWWSYEIEALHTTIGPGYAFYSAPNHKEFHDQEWFFEIAHNDAWLWKWALPANDAGVLNPKLTYWGDTRLAPGAGWLDVEFSHEFELVENVTLTPSLLLGVDHRYLTPVYGVGAGGTRLATIQYGLTVSYDITSLVRFDQLHAGSITVSGSLFYSDALGNPEAERLIEDELFGGVSIGWSL